MELSGKSPTASSAGRTFWRQCFWIYWWWNPDASSRKEDCANWVAAGHLLSAIAGIGPLHGIHFIILSAPPLASQVKSPYPSQYIATLFEKTTLACWFARQVQMLRWGKLAWFSGLLSRWTPKQDCNILQHLCNPEARVKLYIIWQQTSHYLRLPLQAELSGGSASESIDAEMRMLQASRKAVLMELSGKSPTASSAGRTFLRQCFWIYWCWNPDASSRKEGCANWVAAGHLLSAIAGIGPLHGIHFIILSAPPLASQVKSPYPSQYIAALFEKTTLACWFARQVQMLRWGKLAWTSSWFHLRLA